MGRDRPANDQHLDTDGLVPLPVIVEGPGLRRTPPKLQVLWRRQLQSLQRKSASPWKLRLDQLSTAYIESR